MGKYWAVQDHVCIVTLIYYSDYKFLKQQIDKIDTQDEWKTLLGFVE